LIDIRYFSIIKRHRPGQIPKLLNLAETLCALAEHGKEYTKDRFYKGRITETIVEIIEIKSGVMELEDYTSLLG
jgi:gamma-glutamyltranspeptidase/glutathione hydrolase